MRYEEVKRWRLPDIFRFNAETYNIRNILCRHTVSNGVENINILIKYSGSVYDYLAGLLDKTIERNNKIKDFDVETYEKEVKQSHKHTNNYSKYCCVWKAYF